MKIVRTLDKTQAPYYVDRRFCVGKACVYQGVLIKNADKLVDNNAWVIAITDKHKNKAAVHWSDVEATGLDVSTNDRMTDVMKDVLSSKIVSNNLDIRLPVDAVFVSRPNIENNIKDPLGRGAIYVSEHVGIEISGVGYNVLSYIGDFAQENKPRLFYHLCANISFIFGDCRKSLDNWDGNINSNISSANIYIDRKAQDNDLRWEIGDKPIILNNCNICDYCIKYCPRKAIHNRIDGTHNPINDIAYGMEGYVDRLSIGEQIAKTSRALLGEYAYEGQSGEVPELTEIDGGHWL